MDSPKLEYVLPIYSYLYYCISFGTVESPMIRVYNTNNFYESVNEIATNYLNQFFKLSLQEKQVLNRKHLFVFIYLGPHVPDGNLSLWRRKSQ